LRDFYIILGKKYSKNYKEERGVYNKVYIVNGIDFGELFSLRSARVFASSAGFDRGF